MQKIKDMFFLDVETKVRVFENGVSITQTNNDDVFGPYDSKVRLTNEQIELLFQAIKKEAKK